MAWGGLVYKNRVNLRCCTILNKLFMNRLSGLFHKKIHSLWNRPESLLSENGARCEVNQRYWSTHPYTAFCLVFRPSAGECYEVVGSNL